MAICNKCGGTGRLTYEDEEARDLAFGVTWLHRHKIDAFCEVGDECNQCWGTGDTDATGVHPKARSVALDNAIFLKHPSVLPEGESMYWLTRWSESFRFADMRPKTQQRWVERLQRSKTYWANLSGRSSRECDITKEERPFWATHLYIRDLRPPSR